jgi:hypothetical protein
MLLSHVRFTVRQVMLAVAVLAGGLWVVLRWDTDSQVSQGIGLIRIPVIFLVTDSGSGHPIEGAAIRLRDRDYDSNPRPPYVLDLKTGPDGRATASDDWTFVVGTGVPSGRLRGYQVRYPQWEMTFTAEGYQPVAAMFADYERGDRRFHESKPPPPIVIRLKKLPRPIAVESASSVLSMIRAGQALRGSTFI